MDGKERHRLIAITRGFNDLQGLVYSPMGMAMCAWILLDWTWPRSNVRDVTKLLFLLVGLAGSAVAVRYYHRRFGVVRADRWRSSPVLTVTAAIALLWGASWLDVNTGYPVSFEALWWVLFYVVCAFCPRRPFSLWLASVFFVVALLPLTGSISKGQFFLGRSMPGEFFIWFAFSLHGLLDHLLLLRLLPPREQSAQ